MILKTFQGKRIQPPDGPTRVVGRRSTEEERNLAKSLREQGWGWRDIARKITRESGVNRSDTTVRVWVVGR